MDDNITFHNYSGSRARNFGQLQNYHNNEETSFSLKAIYDSRINRLEDEVHEIRKLFLELVKKNI